MFDQYDKLCSGYLGQLYMVDDERAYLRYKMISELLKNLFKNTRDHGKYFIRQEHCSITKCFR